MIYLSCHTGDLLLKKYFIPSRAKSESKLKEKTLPSPEELVQLYLGEFKTTKEIGEMYGISNQPIRRLLKDYRIPIRGISEARLKGKRLPSKEDLTKLYIKKKKGIKPIGQLYKVTSKVIRRLLKKYKISSRSLSEAMLKGKTLPSKKEIYQKYIVEGRSAREIRKDYRIGKDTIIRLLMRYNIPIRDSLYKTPAPLTKAYIKGGKR